MTTQQWIDKFETAIKEIEELENPTEWDRVVLQAYKGQAATLKMELVKEQRHECDQNELSL